MGLLDPDPDVTKTSPDLDERDLAHPDIEVTQVPTPLVTHFGEAPHLDRWAHLAGDA